MQYVIVNEAGASVYSASKLATEEFPKFDVGQYQHDMNQKKLGEALGGVVEDCVNKVGVDLNTASAPLLSYISGISGTLAKNIVAYREENGKFENRKELLKVPKLGPLKSTYFYGLYDIFSILIITPASLNHKKISV